MRAVEASNDLCDNAVMSAFELATKFTKPVADDSEKKFPRRYHW